MTNSYHAPKRAPAPVFVATSIVIFFLSLSAADSVGFVPYYIDGSTPLTTGGSTLSGSAQNVIVATGGTKYARETVALADLPELGPSGLEQDPTDVPPAKNGVEPERIAIPSVALDLPVQNPQTRNIARLDELLKDGPVRYVDSAKLGEKGNVLIFAHTSHLPVVKNQMYKAFNRIPELKAGDSITIQGEGKSYLYTVTGLRKANVEDAIIDLSQTLGQKLTLVTCDTLTGKSARFILEADFVATI